MTKFLLPVTALLVLLAVFWKRPSGEAPYPATGQVEISQFQLLTEPPREVRSDGATSLSPPSPTGKRALARDTNFVTLRVLSEKGSALENPLAFLQNDKGSVLSIELDEHGYGVISRRANSYRLFAGAEHHKSGWVVVAPEEDSVELELEALIDLHGRWIEDGGVPPYEVRFTAEIKEESGGAPLTKGREERKIRTRDGGQFTIAGVPRGAELKIELPRTHVFEETEASPTNFTSERNILISERPIELRTMRKPSVFGRIVRADDGRPVPRANVIIRSINEFGRTRGESDEDCDEYGIVSNPIYINGEVDHFWAAMSPAERRQAVDCYPRIRYEIVPAQADLLPVTADVDLPSAGFFCDLGTIPLPVLSVREVKIVDASGRGLPGAAVQVAELPAVHADEDGIARLPAVALADHGCRALASGYGLGALAASMIPSQEDSPHPPELVLRPGPEVLMTLPKEFSGATQLRLEYSWDKNPFEALPCTDFWFESDLFEALLGYEATPYSGDYDGQNPTSAGTGFGAFDNTGKARLLSLRPGAVLFVAITEPNRFTHKKQRIEVPRTSETLHLELKYDPTDLQAAPAWSMRGMVRDDVGRPVRAAKLSWRHGGHYGTQGTERSDADGAFEFKAFLFSETPTVDLELLVEHEGYYPAHFVWEKAPPDPLQIVLARSRRLEFTVRDTDGRHLLTSPPPYDGRYETPDAERLGVGHWLYPRFPYEARDFVFQVGLENYTRAAPEGAESLVIELPTHGHLVAEYLDLPDEMKLSATLRAAGGADPRSLTFEVSAWSRRRSYDLLPGIYEIELEGREPRPLQILPNETLRIDLGAY